MELKPHFDILVPGVYFCDIIFTGLPVFPARGTSTAPTRAQLEAWFVRQG